jgi:hypothetical protein
MVKHHRLKNVRIKYKLSNKKKSAKILGLEMPVATQKTDTGLSMGLLKILHKQVSINFNFQI